MTRTLHLRREVLTELTDTDLASVGGGDTLTPALTIGYSLCLMTCLTWCITWIPCLGP